MVENTFFFSKEHLIVLLIFAIFLYFCPRLTRNLLPYSYIVEKIICGLIILEIVFEQVSIVSMGSYDVFTSLPIGLSRFCAYICIAILFFKQYQLFNIFFSWSIVCAVGELIFFPDLGYRFPNILYYLDIFAKFILIYANVYLMEVRKFKVSNTAIKENLMMCVAYFSFIFILNTITASHYSYSFSNFNILSILIFMLVTTIVYIPSLIFDNNDKIYKLKRRK
ncbi:TMEM164 family acyltransferase [[Clostridium] dakarense]|uniref:TMEM164 family acyltransferase n=1 Tax=Faecalimicrobium dakarense TaxID=1301100 RepID=UPI0004B0E13B|nr:YwaF family protein [[Clostridium] dakarense]